MGAKPNMIHLTKDKAIGAHDGFVDTFNYLVDSVDGCQLEAGPGIKIDDKGDGKFKITNTAQYVDSPFSSGGGGGPGEVTFHGTDSSTSTGSEFTFEAMSGSNIKVQIADDTETGQKSIVIGAFYV